MTIIIKRFFLLFFLLVTCLFLAILIMPSITSVDAAGLLTTQQQVHPPNANVHMTNSGSSPMPLMQAVTPTVAPTTPVTPVPTAMPTTPVTPVPTAMPTTVPVPPTPPATLTPTPTPALSPTPTTVSTPLPTPTPTPGGNTNTNDSHTALNAMIFTMGGIGMLLVIVGGILYFVYSRPG